MKRAADKATQSFRLDDRRRRRVWPPFFFSLFLGYLFIYFFSFLDLPLIFPTDFLISNSRLVSVFPRSVFDVEHGLDDL